MLYGNVLRCLRVIAERTFPGIHQAERIIEWLGSWRWRIVGV